MTAADADDAERDGAGRSSSGRGRAGAHVAATRGSGCVLVAADGAVLRGRHRAARRPRTPRSSPSTPPGRRRRPAGRHRVRHPRAVLPPRPHRRPCADALVDAGVARVVVGHRGPRPAGRRARASSRLRAAGIDVDVGVGADEVADAARALPQAPPHRPAVRRAEAGRHRSTAAPPRPTASSQWITGPEARADAHRLRAESDAVARRRRHRAGRRPGAHRARRAAPRGDPLRVVLGQAPAGRARSTPASSSTGALAERARRARRPRASCRSLVEGGATVAGAFHRAGLVDRYVLYLAPPCSAATTPAGCSPARAPPTIDDVWRGRIASVEPLGDDLRVDLDPDSGRPECSPASSRSSARSSSRDGAAAAHRAPRTVLDDVDARRRRSPSTAAASPSSAGTRRRLVGGRRRRRDLRPHRPRRARARRPRQPRAPRAAQRPPRRPPRAGPRRRRRRDRHRRARPAGPHAPRACCATWSRRARSRRRHQPHRRRRARRRLHRRRHPAHHRGHHARRTRARATR